MISYLTHDCIDKKRWDECVAHAANGNVYAWSWYLDIVHPGWEALVEMDYGNYLTIMPITRKRKYLVNYLCQPFFAQQLGVFSVEQPTQTRVMEFLRAIPAKYRLVEIRLNEGNPLGGSCNGVDLHRNHLLDLSCNYNILSSNYHENTSRNLKKSLKFGLQLVKGVSMQNVINLFRANRGSSVSHWGNAEYDRLLYLSDYAISSNNAFVYGIKKTDNDDIICGALFLKSHHRITFLFSGNSIAGMETQAMTFLIDQVIREYAGQGLTLDFEGSDDENLARFYRGFGSVPVTYPAFNFRFRNPLR